MSETGAAPAPAAPAPAQGKIQGAPTGDGTGYKKGGAINLDALVAGAMEAAQADAQGTTEAPPSPEMHPAEVPEPDEQTEPEPEFEQPDGGKGSKENPLTVQDLAQDKFIKLKIDGVEEVVSMNELGRGYIREQTFRGRVQRTSELANEVTAIREQLQKQSDTTKGRITQLIEDGDVLYRFMMGNEVTEAALQRAAVRYAQQAKLWREQPQERLRHDSERERSRLQRERQEWEAHRTREDTTRRERDMRERLHATLAPAFQAGIRESGFANPQDPEFQQEIRVRVAAVTQQTGKAITPEEFKACVIRAAKFLGTAPIAPKPAPAAKPTPRPAPTQQAPRNGAKPPRRGSVEAIVAGLKPPRF